MLSQSGRAEAPACRMTCCSALLCCCVLRMRLLCCRCCPHAAPGCLQSPAGGSWGMAALLLLLCPVLCQVCGRWPALLLTVEVPSVTALCSKRGKAAAAKQQRHARPWLMYCTDTPHPQAALHTSGGSTMRACADAAEHVHKRANVKQLHALWANVCQSAQQAWHAAGHSLANGLQVGTTSFSMPMPLPLLLAALLLPYLVLLQLPVPPSCVRPPRPAAGGTTAGCAAQHSSAAGSSCCQGAGSCRLCCTAAARAGFAAAGLARAQQAWC